MRIKAEIEDDQGRSSVEFSVEEMIGHTRLAWRDMDEEARMQAIRDYAAWLYSRQNGRAGDARVRVDRATLPH